MTALAFLVLGSFCAAAQNVRFSESSMPLRKAFSEIEEQTSYTVSFNGGLVDVDQMTSTPVTSVSLADALSQLLQGTGADYRIVNSQIVIFPIKSSQEDDQDHYLGTVVDKSGEPLAGAYVVNGTTKDGVMTDSDGKFSILAKSGDVLTVSFLGFVDAKVTCGQRRNLRITMENDNMSLDESIVVGYGSVKRRDLTTAVSAVSTKDISERPITSAASVLQGKAAGVQVIQPSGMPGTSLSIRVRGATSIQASNEPLYVVDGTPTDDISNISPEDIGSIQVLKDASSSAIYGARAANGVVLITTKRGSVNQVELRFNGYAGISKLGKKIEALNTEEYKVLMKELAKTTVTVPTIPDSENRYTDWTDELFKTGVTQNYQLSLRNGNEKLRYFISLGHSNEKGIVNKAFFRRNNFRANIDSDMFKWLSISFNAAYSYNKGRSVYESRSAMRAGSILAAVNTPPFMQVWDRNDPSIYDEDAYGARISNPIGANAADMTNSTDRTTLGISADFKPFNGLVYKTSYSIDLNNGRSDYYLDPKTTSDGRSTKGYVSTGSTRNHEWLWENIVTYSKVFGGRHDFSIMGGSSIQHAQWNSSSLAGYDLPESYPDIHSVAVANQLDQDATGAYSSAWSLASFLGRVTYNFDSKYLFSANVRADGSSKFAPGHRWGVFPSVSAAWRISNEKFMQNARTWLDDLKIRAGWGINGNQSGIGNYSYLAYMSGSKVAPTADNSYPGLAITPYSASNSELTWEKTTQWNAGVDISVLNSRINLSADAYYKKTKDLLLTVTLPDNVNLPGGITRNDGEMLNKGLEFTLSTKNLIGEFKWNTDFNISFNKNRVEKLGLNKVYYYASQYTTGEYAIILKEGLELGTFFGYVSKGVDPETGDLIYEDRSGNGSIGPEDRTEIGSAQPDFTYGLTNDFSWKGLSLSIFLQGSQGNDIFNGSKIDMESMIDFKNQSKSVLRRWQRPGMKTDIPRSGNVENIHNSTRFVEDGSYLRLKSLTLSYTLPEKITSKIRMKQMQVYVTGQNLFTITDYSGYDPEVNAYGSSSVALGVDYGTYPQSKSMIFGVNFTF